MTAVSDSSAVPNESGQYCNPDCWRSFDDDSWILMVTFYNNQDILGTKRD